MREKDTGPGANAPGPVLFGSLRVLRGSPFVEGGIGKVDILGVHLVLAQPQAFAEALEVDDLPLPEEADDVVHVRVVGQAENVVVGLSGLLFWCDLVRTTCLLFYILGDLDVKAFYQRLLKECHTLSPDAKKVQEAIEKA